MSTTTFNIEKAEQIEGSVCKEFGCSIGKIVGYADSFEKKVVVFLLVKHLGFDYRMVGRKYQMSYLYIPTVITEMEQMAKVVAVFKVKVQLIINQLGNEKVLDCCGK